VLGLLVALAIATFAYQVCWGRFYQMDVDVGGVYLRYFCPARTVTLQPADIATIVAAKAQQRRRLLRLEVTTTHGQRYLSQAAPPNRLRSQQAALKALLGR
jgi:hypothetical protein